MELPPEKKSPGEGVPRIHSNAMRTHMGPFDLTLDFGFRVGTGKDEPELLAQVSMSWEHAVAMVKALQLVIDQYEEQAGKLPTLEPSPLSGAEERR